MSASIDNALGAMWKLWLTMGEHAGRAEIKEGTAFMTTGLPYAPCNQAIINNVSDPEAAVDAVVAHFGALQLPFIAQIWHEAKADEIAKDRGLVEAVKFPLMIAEPVDRAGAVAPARIRIRLSAKEDLPESVAVAAECFEMPPEGMAAFLSEWMLDDPSVRVFVATHEEQIVGTGLAALADDIVGVFNITTLPKFRRRGIGEALTAACIRFGAEQGVDAAYLQASPMGQPVYERMGFEEVGYHMGYVKK